MMNRLHIDSRENSELTESVMDKANSMNIQYEKEWLDVGD